MCGRYELHTHPAAIALAFGLSAPPALRPRYNIAPMQPVPIVGAVAVGGYAYWDTMQVAKTARGLLAKLASTG